MYRGTSKVREEKKFSEALCLKKHIVKGPPGSQDQALHWCREEYHNERHKQRKEERTWRQIEGSRNRMKTENDRSG